MAAAIIFLYRASDFVSSRAITTCSGSEMTYKRKKQQGGHQLNKKYKTKRRKKDLDEIDNDMKEGNAEKLLKQEIDFDKPGLAQHYCLHCARYFIDDQAITEHFRTKVHKRRLKALELEPYSIEEAEKAAGHGSYVPPKNRKVLTQPKIFKEEMCEDS